MIKGLSIFLCLLALFIVGCTLFPKDETLLREYSVGKRSFKAYYVGLGATTNDVIHIKEVSDNNTRFITSIEGYNSVLDMQLKDQWTLVLILSDTSNSSNRPDTLRINLK